MSISGAIRWQAAIIDDESGDVVRQYIQWPLSVQQEGERAARTMGRPVVYWE